MSKTSGIIAWLNTCPQITVVDMSQTTIDAQGLYKQAAVTVQECIDGSKFITENYYILFSRDAQVNDDRISNEELLENFENWIDDQEYAENYPDIGYPVERVCISNSYTMMSRDDDSAVYQATLQIMYFKDVFKKRGRKQ